MNRDYAGTHYNLVSQYFTEVFKAYEKENRIDEIHLLVHVSVHAFESSVKRNWSRYEDNTKEVVAEAECLYSLSRSPSDELETHLNTRMVLPSEEIDIL